MLKYLTLFLITTGFLTACGHTPEGTGHHSSPHKAGSKTNQLICIAPNVHVDPAMPEQQRKLFLQTVKQSRHEISRFFGGLQSSPDIYACATSNCLKQFGGIPAKAKAIGDDTIILSQQGLDKTTLAHELAHIEFHKRLGTPHVWNKVPMWFDEGLAVLACKDPEFSSNVPMMSLHKLRSQKQWVSAVKNRKPAYHVARQAVETWYRGAGTQGLQALIERLRRGDSFNLGDQFEETLESQLQVARL